MNIILIILFILFILFLWFRKKKRKPIRKYDLNPKGAKKVNNDLMQLYIVENFLNKEECDNLIKSIKKDLVPSGIFGNNDPTYRTSSTSPLKSPNDQKFVNFIINKITKLMGIPIENTERIQGQHYLVGQEFKYHTDWFFSDSKDCEIKGNRTWTFMIYLNDVEEGGETHFKNIDFYSKPKMGRAIIWNNLNKDGSINTKTVHAGLPIKKGEKNIITLWFREHSVII